MKFAYFPGCKIPHHMPEYGSSVEAVCSALGIELVKLEFNCCGYPVRHENELASIYSAIRNIAMAEAKGLSDARVRYAYAARNALLPSVTALALSFGALFGGSLITEVVFNYPGVGNLLYLGIVGRDFPLIQGQLLIMTLAMLLANLAVDLAYVFLDPRLKRA